MGIAMREVQGIAKPSQGRVPDSSVPHSPLQECKSPGIFPLALGQRKSALVTQAGTAQHSVHRQIAMHRKYRQGLSWKKFLSEMTCKGTAWLSSGLSVLPVRNNPPGADLHEGTRLNAPASRAPFSWNSYFECEYWICKKKINPQIDFK